MQRKKNKILAISGSTKKNSSNGSILKHIALTYKDQLEVDIFEDIDQLPHFNPDLEGKNLPTVVQEFRDRITSSDGVIICTPEYVFSLPGSLKNAIEWNVSTTNFSNKPVAFIVAAASGEKAFEALDLILTTIECSFAEKSRLLIKGLKGKVQAGGIITDQVTAKNISVVVESLIDSIHEKSTVPNKYKLQNT